MTNTIGTSVATITPVSTPVYEVPGAGGLAELNTHILYHAPTDESGKPVTVPPNIAPEQVEELNSNFTEINAIEGLRRAVNAEILDLTEDITANLAEREGYQNESNRLDTLTTKIENGEQVGDDDLIAALKGSESEVTPYEQYSIDNNLSPDSIDTVKLYFQAPTDQGGKGLVNLPDDLLDPDFIGNVISVNDAQIETLQGYSALDMLELQKLTEQSQLLLTSATNLLKTITDTLLTIARNA